MIRLVATDLDGTLWDRTCLAGAGTSVAVRSAAAEVQALAEHLIDPPGEGGWTALLDLV